MFLSGFVGVDNYVFGILIKVRTYSCVPLLLYLKLRKIAVEVIEKMHSMKEFVNLTEQRTDVINRDPQ